MTLAEHTWIPVLPEWVVELQPLLVFGGLIGGVFVLWQMVLTTFEPHKRWKQFRFKPTTVTAETLADNYNLSIDQEEEE